MSDVTESEHPRIVMHGYECLECGFRWRQELYEERARCIACSEPRCRYRGAEKREIAPPTGKA